MNLIKRLYLVLYYGLAIYLPQSHGRFKLGGKLRYYCAKNIFLSCGKNVNIERGARFGDGSKIEIGDNSGIGKYCIIPNDIKIGNNVMMAPNCYIFSNVTHNYLDFNVPMNKSGKYVIPGRVIIGDDVWIGRDVLILACKEIGAHSIIGARSVVSKNIPEYSVVVGNPCKIIKDRRNI